MGVPELPEVETIRRQLAPRVAGRTIVEAEVFDPLWCSPRSPKEVERDLRGTRIDGLDRRGKYLLMSLEGERFLVMHLRMTGNFLWVSESDDVPGRPHLRVRLALDDGHRLLFVDLRRFGTGLVIEGRAALEEYLDARVGPEPLGPRFTPEVLARAARGRSAPVKAFLLDQRRVAGVGNIYADEALFRARIHPLRPAGRLRRPELERLHRGIVEALEAGIARQGASIDNYRDSNGARGSMQDEFLVHLRAGKPCVRCGRPVTKLVAAGRGTYVCRRCQPAPRVRTKAQA
jgi:formamidopyrimidine-DNA glycosylase